MPSRKLAGLLVALAFAAGCAAEAAPGSSQEPEEGAASTDDPLTLGTTPIGVPPPALKLTCLWDIRAACSYLGGIAGGYVAKAASCDSWVTTGGSVWDARRLTTADLRRMPSVTAEMRATPGDFCVYEYAYRSPGDCDVYGYAPGGVCGKGIVPFCPESYRAVCPGRVTMPGSGR